MDHVGIPLDQAIETFFKPMGWMLLLFIFGPFIISVMQGSFSLDISKRFAALFKGFFYLVFAVLTFCLVPDAEGQHLHIGLPSTISLTQILLIPISVLEAVSNFIEFINFE